MSKHIYLSLAIHNHQPVGNFDHVFAEGYRVAYEPMITALERHPAIRMALHYTGPLRDWLVEHQPELMARIRALVARGQVEMMTGGYYEPVLVALPDVDKLGQVRKLTQAVQDDFGYTPTGAWLAERVWEPHLPKPLAEAGVEYTIVDDTHFKYVGLEDKDLFGYYVTEEQGTTLKIFGTSKHLRYVIPWAEVDEVIAWLRDQADEKYRLAVQYQERAARVAEQAGFALQMLDSYDDLAQAHADWGEPAQAQEYLRKISRAVPEEYRLVEGIGFRKLPDPVDGYWLVLGKYYLQRGIWTYNQADQSTTPQEKDRFLDEAAHHFALAMAYFQKFSPDLAHVNLTSRAMYRRFRTLKLERLEHLRREVQDVARKYRVNLSRLLNTLDDALGHPTRSL